jgi:hypothetical protein
MTTLAFDWKELAADSQATSENIKFSCTKIHKGANYIMAHAGSLDEGYAFKAILEGEAKNKDVSLSKGFCAIVWWDTGEAEEYYDTLIPIPIEEKYTAMGTGAGMALAAMYCGKSAKEAVEVAKKFDIFSGGKVVAYSWDTKKKGKKKKNESLSTSDIQEPVREISRQGEPQGGMVGDCTTVSDVLRKAVKVTRLRNKL